MVKGGRRSDAAQRKARIGGKSYTFSTRFFHIHLPLFEIRANNYSPWIQLNPNFLSLPPSSFLSLPAPRHRPRVPRTARPASHRVRHACRRWPCAPAGRRVCHARPRRPPQATRAAMGPARHPHPAPPPAADTGEEDGGKNICSIFLKLVQHF